ncbi:MAG: SdrD B-like domain-containing protein [Verrucomicrobiota bacterium]
MKNSFRFAAIVVASLTATALTSRGHNLDTRATGLSLAQDFVQTMTSRAAACQPLVQVNDTFWIVMKTTPGPGTSTGVGGYQTFYVPQGMQVVDVAYIQPTPCDQRGFVPVPMKGQSPIAIGDGSCGAKISVGLNPSSRPVILGPNINGVSEPCVTSSGLARGTIAGVYADTGIFYSTDTRTAFNSYGATPSGGTVPMTNNSGDTVGEWDSANVAGADVLGVMTLWDADQLRAFGRKDVPAIIDPADARGNAPWGMACAVAGPQSGYAWSFNYSKYNGTAASIPGAIEVGPWNRVKYPGSQVSKDKAGLISTSIGYVGVDASSLGINTTAIPATATAVRFAIGQLELGRSEYCAVKVKILNLASFAGSNIYADAFGGDAGGASNGKDHIWRYFDPTVVSLQPTTLLQKVASEAHIAPGGSTSFAITFANLGLVSLSNITLTDMLPAGLTYVSAVPAPNNVSGSTVTWNIGSVMPNQIVSLTINVKATATGTLLNTVTAASNGQVLANAYDTVDVGVFSLLGETKTASPSSVSAGQNVTYTIAINNNGTGPNGVPLVVTDFLPDGFIYTSFVSATINGASVTPTITTTHMNAPVFTLAQSIQANNAAMITFVATVGTEVPAGTYYNGVDLAFEGKKIGPHPEAPVTVGGAQIGDTVYTDTNGNGTQDAGEPGITGATVTLYNDENNSGIWDTGDTLIGTKITDTNGNYLFTGLPAGNYIVKIPSPPVGTNTGNPPGAAANPINEGAASLPLNGSVLTVDFGYQQSATTGSIGDMVFYDADADGIYDTGDSPLLNVTVNLYASNGTTLLTTTKTDSNGLYTFAGRPAGTYVVKLNLTNSDIPVDLVCSVSGGAYSAFTLAAGQALTTIDFPFTLVFIGKTVNKATASAGDPLTFNIRPYYPGPTQLTNATVTDVVPTGTSYQNASANAGATQAGGTLTWNLGSTATAVIGGPTTISIGPTMAITQRGSTTKASASKVKTLTINKPTGVLAGDVMIVNMALADGSVFPSLAGWNTICNASYEGKNRLHRGAVLYKVANSTDAGITSYTFTLDTTNCEAAAAIVAFSGVDTVGGKKPDGTSGGPFDIANKTATVNTSSSDVSGVTSITTVSANALVLMPVMAWDDAGTVSVIATATSPGALATGSFSYNPTQTIAAGWATKAMPGPTGAGSATLNKHQKWGAILLALKPAAASVNVTSTLSANRSLLTSGDKLSVTLTASATGNVGTLTPGGLIATGSNGASVVCSAATPTTATLNNGSATFTYTCTTVAGSNPGELTFKVTPTSSIGGNWAQATANTVLVTPPLSFATTVNTNAGVSVVTNTAQLKNNATLLQTSPTTTTTLYGTLGGCVWWDVDDDQIWNSNERPITNAYVTLYVDINNNGILDVSNGDYQIAGTLTDASGHYLFNNLPAANYLVDVYEDSFITDGIRNVVPTTAEVQVKTLAGGQTYLGADFGYFQGARVNGNVFWDANRDAVFDVGEAGLPSVTISLTGFDLSNSPVAATVTSDTGGHFYFIVPEGDYTLTYSTPNVLASNPSLTDTTTPTSYAFHAYPGDDFHPVFDFGVDNCGKIGGTIFADVNGNGVQGAGEAGLASVTLELYIDTNNNNIADTGDTLLDSQLSDASGKYLFVGIADGNYIVSVARTTVPTGYDAAPSAHPSTEWTSGSTAGATINGGIPLLDRNFGYHPTATNYSVSGNIWNDNGAGGGSAGDGIKTADEPNLANVTVMLSIAGITYTVITDASGNYSLSGVPAPALVNITVNTATLPNCAFVNTYDPDGVNNSTTTFTMANTAVNGKNFGYNLVLGSIAGTVVAGSNGNGLADTGEAGLSGASITLCYAGVDGILNTSDDGVFPPQTTSASGTYSFTGLAPGIYQVCKTNPASYLSWADADGANPDNITVTLNFGADGIGGNTDDRMVKNHQDFEDYRLGTISGSVLADTNSDKLGEAPISGVTLELRDAATSTLVTTTTTLASGAYTLGSVLPGSYMVVEKDPSGYVSLTPNQVAILISAGESGIANFVDSMLTDLAISKNVDHPAPNVGSQVVFTLCATNNGPSSATGVSVTDTLPSGYEFISANPAPAYNAATGAWVIGDLANAGNATLQVTAKVNATGTYLNVATINGTEQDPDTTNNTASIATTPIALGSITGTVWLHADGYPYTTDNDGNPVRNTALAGVLLSLLDSNGKAVLNDQGVPMTKITGCDGTYGFTAAPGNYKIAETQPTHYGSLSDKDTSFEDNQTGTGDANLIGDQTPVALVAGATNTDNDFIDFRQTYPDHSPFIIAPGVEAIDGLFRRTAGGEKDMTYTLEYAASLTNPVVWNSMTIIVDPSAYGYLTDANGSVVLDASGIPLSVYVFSNLDNDGNPDGTETVVIRDLENVTWPIVDGEGFVRIRVDFTGPGGGTSHTEVLGWSETKLAPGTSTFNKPYLATAVFNGTVDLVNGVIGQTLNFTTSAGPVNLANIIPAIPGVTYYLEVSAGTHEGQRFDVVSVGTNSLTLANDINLYAATPPFNTLTGAPPASLAGSSVIIRPHWTLDSMFPPGALGATSSQTTANQVQVYAGGAWNTYWLYYDEATDESHWVVVEDNTDKTDEGSTVIPPGQGVFFYNNPDNRPTPAQVIILNYGEVRMNDFVQPLAEGNNLVAGGYPVTQSATGADSREMTLANGFFGSLEATTADSFMLWNADATPGTMDYTSYYLYNDPSLSPAQIGWVELDGTTATLHDSEKLLLGNRAAFINAASARPAYHYARPWSP